MAAPLVPAPVRRSSTPALALAVASGAMIAVQQRVNGELKTVLGDAVVAAAVSFGTGLALVAAVVLASPQARAALPAVRGVPWWTCVGGIGGAALVAVGAAAAPVLGVALLTVGLVAGQTAGGIAVDRAGLGPSGRHAPDLPRVAGAVLCLVAVTISVSGDGARGADPVLLALVVATGFLIALQQALNGRVRTATGSAAVATLVNFVVGTGALLLGLAARALAGGVDVLAWPSQWWLYTGGPMGAAFVAVAVVVVRKVGVLRLGLAAVAGQLVGALLLDLGLPVHDTGVAAATVVGTLLTLVAVALSGLGGRR